MAVHDIGATAAVEEPGILNSVRVEEVESFDRILFTHKVRQALEQSLANNRLLAEPAEKARYGVSVSVERIRVRPFLGEDRWTMEARYLAEDRTAKEPFFEEVVESRYVVGAFDTFDGNERRTRGLNGLVNESIRAFIAALVPALKARDSQAGGPSAYAAPKDLPDQLTDHEGEN